MNRVTAGIPSLSSEKRQAIDAARAQREQSMRYLLDDIGRNMATVAKDGDLSVTDAEQRTGNSLTSDWMIGMLKICNPNLHFEIAKADPSKIGIYVIENAGKRFVCGMSRGLMPEASIMTSRIERTPDPDNPGNWIDIPVGSESRRGWLTVLARLYKSRLITLNQISDHWYRYSRLAGKSQHWQQMTQ